MEETFQYAKGDPKKGEDSYWLLEDCAPAVYELLETTPGLQQFITSVDDLEGCLCERRPEYVRAYNKVMRQSRQITKKDGAASQFLKLPGEKRERRG